MVRRRYILALCLVVGAGWACNRRDDLDGSRPSGKLAPPATAAAPDGDWQAAVSLVDNRGAMVALTDRRITVSAHGARLVPFIDGNLRREWRLNAVVDEQDCAAVHGRIANLFIPLDRDAHGVLSGADPGPDRKLVIRFRPATKGQVASVFVNERPLGDLRFDDAGWQTRSLRVPADHLVAGDNRIRFFFRHLGTTGELKDSPGALAWLRVGPQGAAGATPMVRHDGATGEPSLHSPPATRLSFYAAIPLAEREPRLRFAVGGKGAASVGIALPSGRYRELWTGMAGGQGPAPVPLQELAGEVVRLDFFADGEATWINPRIEIERATTAPHSKVATADHIIVWTISSLRADRVGEKTDQLAAFRRKALYFESAWSPGPVAALAHSAILGGRASPTGGLKGSARTLAELMQKGGYATALVSGNGFINDSAGFARGFDTYSNPMRLSRPHSARVLWQTARRFLLRHKRNKTFIYIATSEPHLPYKPTAASLEAEWGAQPQPLVPAKTAALSMAMEAGKATLVANQRSFIRALYDATVRDADSAFGAMLDSLREMELDSSTAIIVVGDHGEALFEDGFFGHGSGLADELVHVPLMVRAQSVQPESRSDPVVLADLFPTVLELAGLSAPISSGRSLLGTPPGAGSRSVVLRNAHGDWAIRLRRYKLVIPAGKPATLVDNKAGERARDIRSERPIVARYLRTALAFAVAFDDVWVEARWGQVDNHSPGFAADHGL